MTQDSESVVVPRVPTEAMLAACLSTTDSHARSIWSAMITAAPSTSVREEVAGALERAAKVADVEERSAIDAFREEATADMRAYRRGRAEAGQCIALAIRALVPSTDEGKRHG